MAADEEGDRPLRHLFRHTLIYGSGYVATAAVSLVLVPVYTFHLTPSDFGLLALMLALYGVGRGIFDLGFTNSVARFYFDQPRDELPRMLATTMGFLVAWGGLLTALLVIPAATWSRLLTGDGANADLVRIVAFMLYAETLAIVSLTLIRMQERSGKYVAITLVRLVFALALSLLFVVVLKWEVRGALLANAIAAGVVVVLVLPDYRRALGSRFSMPLLREMLAFGLPFVPVLLSAWVIDASDRYILELFRDREEVGFYSLAYRFGQVMGLAVAAFSMGWGPLRYKIFSRADAPAVYRRLTTYYVLVASALAVALSVLAAEIVAIVSPPSYSPAAAVVPFMVLAYVLQGLYFLMVTGMGVTKKTLPMSWIAAGGAALNVVLNLLFVPRWGMTAAALSTVAAYVAMVGGSWYASQRVYAIPYDWTRIVRIAALAVAAVGGAAAVSPAGVVAGSAFGVATWLAFIAALVATRLLAREDLARAWTWLKHQRQAMRRRAATEEPAG